jgi:hypothetical protein
MEKHERPARGGTAPEAFYLSQPDGTFAPTTATEGPWDPALQHGGPPAALLGRALETLGGRADTRIASFTLDFFGSVPRAPMRVEARVLRPGKRVELVEATATVDGRQVLRASAWRIAVGPGRSPVIDNGSTNPPLPAREDEELFASAPDFGYGRALEWRFAEGGFRAPGPATVWSRMRVPLVAGEPSSPLARLLTMVDAANGVSWELDFTRHTFVPVVLSVSLTRAPVGEWVGMHARTSLAGDGVGATVARLFDDQGTVGSASQALFVGPR